MNFQFRHLGLLFTGSLLLASAPALAQGALPGSLGVRVTFPQAALHISGDAGGPADLIIEHLDPYDGTLDSELFLLIDPQDRSMVRTMAIGEVMGNTVQASSGATQDHDLVARLQLLEAENQVLKLVIQRILEIDAQAEGGGLGLASGLGEELLQALEPTPEPLLRDESAEVSGRNEAAPANDDARQTDGNLEEQRFDEVAAPHSDANAADLSSAEAQDQAAGSAKKS